MIINPKQHVRLSFPELLPVHCINFKKLVLVFATKNLCWISRFWNHLQKRWPLPNANWCGGQKQHTILWQLLLKHTKLKTTDRFKHNTHAQNSNKHIEIEHARNICPNVHWWTARQKKIADGTVAEIVFSSDTKLLHWTQNHKNKN